MKTPCPAVAIGRLPAGSPEELAVMVKKIVAYEQSADFGPWRRRMNFVAGVGNFGPLADALLESAARMFLTQNIPAEYHVSMTYGNWRSPYCPDPRRFHATAIERLDEGSLFWIYIGHSAPGKRRGWKCPAVNTRSWERRTPRRSAEGQGRPIAMFLSCYAGALDARGRCLASALVGSPGGPVAVVAATRVTMPYAITVMATNLTDECFRGRSETLGEALLHAKQNMLKQPDKHDARRAMLDSIAAIDQSVGQRTGGRAGRTCPAVQLDRRSAASPAASPSRWKSASAKSVPAGGRLEIDGTSPIDGQATVELVLRRDRAAAAVRRCASVYPASDEELAALDDVYQRANDRRLKTAEVAIREGRFQAIIDVPAEAAGRLPRLRFRGRTNRHGDGIGRRRGRAAGKIGQPNGNRPA